MKPGCDQHHDLVPVLVLLVLGFYGKAVHHVEPCYGPCGADPEADVVVLKMNQFSKLIERGFQGRRPACRDGEGVAEISQRQINQGPGTKVFDAFASAHFIQKREGGELG